LLESNTTNTMTKSLDRIFKFGKFLSLTPTYAHPQITLFLKLYALLVALSITAALATTMTKRNFYYMKSAVGGLLDANLLAFNYSTVAVIFCKCEQWHRLVFNLKIVVANLKPTTISHRICIFLVVQLVGVVIIVASLQTWLELLGREFLQKHHVQYFQLYLLFTYNTFLCVIASLILAMYRRLSLNLSHVNTTTFKDLQRTVKTLDNFLHFLKDTVDIFNDIFGWPIALSVSYTTLHIINDCYSIFLRSSFYKNDDNIARKLTADVSLALLFFVSVKNLFVKTFTLEFFCCRLGQSS
jgi:gustatory receptor